MEKPNQVLHGEESPKPISATPFVQKHMFKCM